MVNSLVMNSLAKLFGSQARVKLTRLFLLHPGFVFSVEEIQEKSRIPRRLIARELSSLLSSRLLRRRSVFKEYTIKKGKKTIIKKKKIQGWTLNEEFYYLQGLKRLILSSESFEKEKMLRKLNKTGRIKLLVISGVFVQSDESTLDMLIVGEALKNRAISLILRNLESEIGKDLRYGVLDTKDFLYRLDVYDRFIRDVLDRPHEKLINKLGV